MFRADAWAVVHTEVLSPVPDTDLAASDFGIDVVW